MITLEQHPNGDWMYVPECQGCGDKGPGTFNREMAEFNDNLHRDTCKMLADQPNLFTSTGDNQ